MRGPIRQLAVIACLIGAPASLSAQELDDEQAPAFDLDLDSVPPELGQPENFDIPERKPEAESQEDAQQSDEAPETEVATPTSEMGLDDLFAQLKDADQSGANKISEEITNRWSQSGSDTINLLLKRGRDAMARGEHDKAISHFSRLIAFDPEFAEGWHSRATAFFAEGEAGYSLADLYEVLRLQPRHYGALMGLGIVLESLNRDREALAAYRAAIALHPHIEQANEGIERLAEDVDGQPI